MRNGLLALVTLVLFAANAWGQASPPAATFLQRHCLDCHQGTKAKGDLRLDTLPMDAAGHAVTWGKILDRVTDGSMPPPGKPRPSEEEQEKFTAWIEQGLVKAEAVRNGREGRTTLRRLTRTEYANTLRDLLGIELDLTHQLPEETITNGFDNVAESLSLSSAHLERYLEGADLALDAALRLPPAPRPEKKILRPGTPEELRLDGDRGPLAAISRGENLILFRNQLGRELFRYRTGAAGWYRFRFTILGHNLDDRQYAVEVSTGTTSGAFLFQRLDYFDLTPGKPRVVEFEKRLPRGGALRLVGYGFPQQARIDDPAKYTGPGWGFGPIEVEGPLLKDWPPESRTRLLGNVDPNKGTPADAESILTRFLPRAFRRPTTPAEVARYLKIVRERLSKGDRFEPALRAGLRAVLCSPDFLFLRETPGPLDDFALASRLSYLLIRSMPDATLLDLARAGKLREPRILREQTERLLRDPRGRRFVEDFCDQWLSLRDIDFTTPDKKLYPEYDERLHDAMLEETRLYLEELIRQNRPVREIIASDWTYLNGRLAQHYGIAGVQGQAFRKVNLPADSVRGGFLTQAAVLKVTANGTTTSPVTRGLWVLDRILGQPAPPPPGNVPAIEPDTRGATTIREQLARHRTQEACAGCHRRIDPPGFALESFDPIGGFRERYRSTPVRGLRMPLKQGVLIPGNNLAVEVYLGQPVESADALTDGRRFSGIREFKNLLLADPEQPARNLVQKLVTFATGTPPGRSDRETIESLLAETRRQGHGVRDLLHGVIQSPLFLRK